MKKLLYTMMLLGLATSSYAMGQTSASSSELKSVTGLNVPDVCYPAKAGTSCFALKSPDLTPGIPVSNKFMFNGFGCTGENISPAFVWSNAPAGTKSFAITLHDPDAPTGGGGWWHWMMYNIPANITSLAEGAASQAGKLPAGIVIAKNDFGTHLYGGPCPPQADGMHRYEYSVWALDVDKLPIPDGVSPNFVGFMINAHVLGHAMLVVPGTRN